MEYVFVYGSLKDGFGNDHFLLESDFIQTAVTPPQWDMLDLGAFPAVVVGDYRVSGEIYMVDEWTMGELDRLEGHPSFYKRELVDITGFGERVWMYVLTPRAHQDYIEYDDLEPVSVQLEGDTKTWIQPRGDRNGFGSMASSG